MASQTDVFRQTVGAHMRAAPACIAAGTPMHDAVRQMTAAGASSLIVADGDRALIGIVTEQDVVRRIAFKLDADETVETAMSQPVETIRDTAPLYHAIATMRRRGLRHMPVVDGDRRPVGIIELHEALSVAARQMVGHIDSLSPGKIKDHFQEFKAAHVSVATELLHDHVPPHEILGLISHLNTDLYRHVIDDCLDTCGPAPAAFAVIVMGSAGRGESAFGADQDNGLIIADYPDADHDRIDGYFRDFADRMTDGLEQAGFPKCRGHVMASNPLWRKTATQWTDQVDFWLRRRSPGLIRLADIFFDFQSVYGPDHLAGELRDQVTVRTASAPVFLQAMHMGQIDHRAAVGWFNRLLTERRGRHRGQLNLKYGALLPLVEAVRLLALKHGVRATGTLSRMTDLASQAVLDADEHDTLIGAFDTVTGLIVGGQIDAINCARPADYWLSPGALRRGQRRRLVAALTAIQNLRDRIRLTFTGDVF